MRKYGNDKPDIRFGMKFAELDNIAKNKGFNVFDQQELVVGIAVPGAASYTRKQIDALISWVKRPQIGANGLVWAKYNEDGSLKSSVDKFYTEEDLKEWAQATGAKPGDLILVMAGDANKTRSQLSALRMHLGNELGLRKPDEFAPLWVIDFPLLEWDEETAEGLRTVWWYVHKAVGYGTANVGVIYICIPMRDFNQPPANLPELPDSSIESEPEPVENFLPEPEENLQDGEVIEL